MTKRPILTIRPDELSRWLAEQQQPAYRANQIRRWVFRDRAVSFGAMTDLPAKLRACLEREFTVFGCELKTSQVTPDDTRKMLIGLRDGHLIETVLLCEAERNTVCVSTQVGCAMRCSFCASGLDGVVRDLEPNEIVEQFLLAEHQLGADKSLTHAVIMGIGEPLANLHNLLTALDEVCHRDGLSLGQRHVTISTVGLPRPIRQLADSGRRYHLAISLHAPDDELRSLLVPPNANIGIQAILSASDYFRNRTGRQVTFEYVLLRNVNDSVEHARALVRTLSGRKVHVNLIPYNSVQGLPFRTPNSKNVLHFAQILRRGGLSATVRKTKGRRIDAACGQLRLSRSRPDSTLQSDSHVSAEKIARRDGK